VNARSRSDEGATRQVLQPRGASWSGGGPEGDTCVHPRVRGRALAAGTRADRGSSRGSKWRFMFLWRRGLFAGAEV